MSPSAESAALGLAQLRQDPQFPRIAPERHERLVAEAIADGRFLADDVKACMGGDPAFIAASCGVPVIDSEQDAGYGSVAVFAEYAVKARTIVLYGRAIRRLDAALANARDAAFAGLRETRPVFLAHELYHHLDCLRSTPLRRRHTVTLFGIGRWAWRSGLTSLPEIAAGAFAQALLDLDFHPGRLDILARQP